MSSQRYVKVALIALAALGIVVVFFRGFPVEKYRDGKVSAGEIRRPWDVFTAHVSRPQYLKVGGRMYRRVRGSAPYYLDVPGTNSILFVTQDAGHITFHIFDLNRKEDVQIDGGTSGFGWHLGKPGDKFSDYIEVAKSNRITLVKGTHDWMEKIALNLTNKGVERTETLYFDASGQVTNRSIHSPSK